MISTSAVRGTLIAMALAAGTSAAWAQEAAQDANLTRPISTFEAGALGVSNRSFKAGEYNGLQKKGGLRHRQLRLEGRRRVRQRQRAALARQGRRSRASRGAACQAEVGVQGKSRLTVGYDELLRNRTDSFQTIFDGAGTTRLTLPGTWLIPNVAGSTAANSATNITSARGLVKSVATQPYINLNTASPNLRRRHQSDGGAAGACQRGR